MFKFFDLTRWLLILTIFVSEGLVEGRTTTMKAVNKAIIKTIKVENDEIIDCYDIYRQPSLNHPFLHNHTIQMRPSSYPKGMKTDNLGTLQLTQILHKYGSCLLGTIPIRRKGKNYNPALLRKHHYPRLSPYKTSVTSHSNDTADDSTEDSGDQNMYLLQYATIKVVGNFLGAQAKINLWKPYVEKNGLSISQIWVVTEDKNTNTIEVGWEVCQNLYGDDRTRFFLLWTADGYTDTGCYNLLCDGFVHTASNVSLDCSFSDVSTFNGSQKDVTFSIHKDQSSGHWWVQLQGIPIGYYPSSLFDELSKEATRHTSTQMGSGHFPSDGGLKTSSYFNWVQVVDENNMMKDPENVETYVTNPNCYDLKIDNGNYDTNGYTFYYGGPGYNDRCQ
ncbi:hypothetical protein MKW98_032389 [Papaver atlanticum]|uniref:Neprosin PEP catalytic domain-containing protein n=1 Tax=Papaver atlanticum TaxID=357466 RepID=A0AAD4SU69_9MAGN|nr:hypothetical protein MKW98_032389 [Papaver atlanticum]